MFATVDAIDTGADQAIDDALELSIDQWDVTRHNGTVTILNPATGHHRTFRIATAQNGALAGKRIVSILAGPSNESDYQGFAFADDFGISVWRKHRGQDGPSSFETYAKMLMSPKTWAEHRGLVYRFAGRCRRCNRTLTDPTSIELGLGPVCADR